MHVCARSCVARASVRLSACACVRFCARACVRACACDRGPKVRVEHYSLVGEPGWPCAASGLRRAHTPGSKQANKQTINPTDPVRARPFLPSPEDGVTWLKPTGLAFCSHASAGSRTARSASAS